MSVSSVSIVDFEQVNVYLVNILPTITLLKNSVEKRNIKVNKINFELTWMHSFHPVPWVIGGGGGGVLDHFSEHLSRRDLSQIGIFGGNYQSRSGWFQLGLENSLYEK